MLWWHFTVTRLSLERPAAHAVFGPHPQAVEGDFTFVTIIHLIGFQLSGRRSGGSVCVRPPSFSAHQREHMKMTNRGSVASGTVCLLERWTGLVQASVCCHPSLSGACGSNPTGLPPAPMAFGASPSPWGSSSLENRVESQGKGE